MSRFGEIRITALARTVPLMIAGIVLAICLLGPPSESSASVYPGSAGGPRYDGTALTIDSSPQAEESLRLGMGISKPTGSTDPEGIAVELSNSALSSGNINQSLASYRSVRLRVSGRIGVSNVMSADPGEDWVYPQQSGPGDPTNLQAASAGTGRVRLTWQSARHADHHWIWSVKADGSDGKWTEASGADDSAIVADLESGQAYSFMVIAGGSVNGAPQWSQWSNRVEFLVTGTGTTGRFTAVSAGFSHTCGVAEDGSVTCWGKNDAGQATPPEGRFLSVSAGKDYTCGVKHDGRLACWGRNDYGRATPPVGRFTAVSAGKLFTCGLREDGSVACWGQEYRGDETLSTVAYDSVSTGDVHACGLRESGAAVCWTRNLFAQGQPPAVQFKSISSGSNHSCGVQDNDTVACWDNVASRGLGAMVQDHGQSTPPSGEFASVSGGGAHTCGIKKDDSRVVCWGWDDYGQSMPPEGSFVAVSAGGIHTCGLKEEGSVVCWGRDDEGQSTPPAGTLQQETSTLASPANLTAVDGSNPGEVDLTWDAVANANFYRIGWVDFDDAQAANDEGRDWLDAFVFVDVTNLRQTSYTVIRLEQGVPFAFIVGSVDTRFGAAEWSEWQTLTLKTDPSAPTVPSLQPIPETPPASAGDCYVGLELRPGLSCNWPEPVRAGAVRAVISIINGGSYHGQVVTYWESGSIWLQPADRNIVTYTISTSTSDTRYRFHVERKSGNIWVITKVNEPFER